ncbi:tRNA lysidine(34) synthetase TilS [Balneolales bacterium ANBcel1]|nr:tRNA lysidine(34) synthetase TilS [Balneolales bacterium ANBcel1]
MHIEAHISQHVHEFLERIGFAGEEKLVVGVSGGPDSMALLHVLARSYGRSLVAAHVNYGKRGAESDSDQHLVAESCRQWNVPLEIKDVRVHDIGERITAEAHKSEEYQVEESKQCEAPAGNFQDYARRVRRTFFLDVMKRHSAAAVAMAHHSDDQMETVFQKILRGSAPEHWAGMRGYDPPWLRPLLGFSRSDLLAYAEHHRVPYRIDRTNLTSDYARNLLRNRVFPELENHFPGWRSNLERIAGFGSLHREMLDYLLSGVVCGGNAGGGADSGSAHYRSMRLNRKQWFALPEPLRLPVARHWVREAAGFTGWSHGLVDRLSDLGQIQTGARISVTERLHIIRDRDCFVLVEPEVIVPKADEAAGRFSGTAEGSTLQRAGRRTDAETSTASGSESAQEAVQKENAGYELRSRELVQQPLTICGCVISAGRYRPDHHAFRLQLRLDSLPETLILRRWRAGDRLQPLGMNGSQLISDHLVNRKIPSTQKNETLVLVSFDETVHAVIFPQSLKSGEVGTIAEHARCHTEGEHVLLIQKQDHPS